MHLAGLFKLVLILSIAENRCYEWKTALIGSESELSPLITGLFQKEVKWQQYTEH